MVIHKISVRIRTYRKGKTPYKIATITLPASIREELEKRNQDYVYIMLDEPSGNCDEVLKDFQEFIDIIDVLFNEFTDTQLIRLSEKYPHLLEKLKLLKKKYKG